MHWFYLNEWQKIDQSFHFYSDGPKLSQSKLLRRSSALQRKLQEHFVKSIPWEDILEATNDFSDDRQIGVGGYGTVYRGIGPSGELWAVKRAKVVSKQSLSDFQNEVILLAVHIEAEFISCHALNCLSKFRWM